MPYDGRQIANFILDFCNSQNREVTNLAIQKLVFFCHAWSLVILKKPLIRHEFEAWEHGPVLPYLYREFKEYDSRPISKRATRLNALTGCKEVAVYEFDDETENLIKSVLLFYSRLSAWNLRELSHAEGGPWEQIWNHKANANPGMKINNDIIEKFYSQSPHPRELQ